MQIVNVSGMHHLDDIDSNASTNTASTLATLTFTVKKTATASGQEDLYADMALIQVETAAVRVGAGTPTQAGLGIKLEPGQFVLLETEREIEQTKFISAVAGNHATLQAQIGYKKK